MKFFKWLYNGIRVRVAAVVKRCYDWHVRENLKNKDFSLFCPTCLGGMIYHRLGVQSRSPTVNLWMYQRDFLKMAMDLRRYMETELVFFEHECGYPTARLIDITIFFNHSKTKEDARRDWNRRRERINYDNLFFIFYEDGGITEEDILNLESISCRNKLVLSDKKHPGIKYVKTIKPSKRKYGNRYIDKDWLGFTTFEKHFDYVGWLNS